MTATYTTTLADSAPTPDEERLQRRRQLAATLRLFAKFGFEYGTDGHVTVRDPILEEHFWVNPYGVPFGLVRVSDLVLVDRDGTVVDGDHTPHPGFAFHYQLHNARADATAVLHVHSPYGLAFSSSPRLLEPINQDSGLLYNLQCVYNEYGTAGGVVPLGAAVAGALGPNKTVVVQRHHGFVTVGQSIGEAFFYFISAERAARAQLLAEAAGHKELIADNVARKLTLEPERAARHFLPYWQEIVHHQPELLD
jgi:ribulose-5-phosphate 4-epimerase/fuculose-1-phosphate aldolase